MLHISAITAIVLSSSLAMAQGVEIGPNGTIRHRISASDKI